MSEPRERDGRGTHRNFLFRQWQAPPRKGRRLNQIAIAPRARRVAHFTASRQISPWMHTCSSRPHALTQALSSARPTESCHGCCAITISASTSQSKSIFDLPRGRGGTPHTPPDGLPTPVYRKRRPVHWARLRVRRGSRWARVPRRAHVSRARCNALMLARASSSFWKTAMLVLFPNMFFSADSAAAAVSSAISAANAFESQFSAAFVPPA
jgi:hypothetical protein